MDLKSHFLSVEKHLNTGGLYIIEAAHFKSLSDSKSRTVNEWTTENGNKKVFFKWTNLITPNLSEQIYDSLVSIQVEFNGELFKIEDKFKMRLNKLEDFKNSISLNLNLKDAYGNFDKADLNDPKAWRMILVFEKV